MVLRLDLNFFISLKNPIHWLKAPTTCQNKQLSLYLHLAWVNKL